MNADTPVIAVIIPVFNQSQYLIDAVTSALGQSLGRSTRVVIVNDGCRHPGTDALCRFFARTDRRVVYLKQSNGGLSAARNRGIRFAQAMWPEMRAVFPLDADNALSPQTLELALAALDEDGADWAYLDQEAVGATNGIIRRPPRFSLYRLMITNFCDAGSLIHRRVFDAGLWFDETDPSIPEDWDFFVRAGLAGFRGRHVPDAGFQYRIRGGSLRLTRTGSTRLTTPYWPVLEGPPDASRIAALERDEMPRFAFIEPATASVHFGSHPAEQSGAPMPVDSFKALLASPEPAFDTPYVPPIGVVADRSVLAGLIDGRLWDGLAFALQSELAVRPVARADITTGPLAWSTTGGGRASVSFVRTNPAGAAELAAADGLPGIARITLPRVEAQGDPDLVEATTAELSALVNGTPGTPLGMALQGSDRAFADAVHGAGFRRFVLPYGEPPRFGLVIPSVVASTLATDPSFWELVPRTGTGRLIVVGEGFSADPPRARISSIAVIPHAEPDAATLHGLLFGTGPIVFVDMVVATDQLARLQVGGHELAFVCTSSGVQFGDWRLGVAQQAAVEAEPLFSRYAAADPAIAALFASWGVPDHKLTAGEDAPSGVAA